MAEDRPTGQIPTGPPSTPQPPPPAAGTGAGGPVVNWAPPPPPAEIPGAPGLTFADTPSRFVAYVIDLFIVGIIAFIVAAALGQGQTRTVTSGSNTFSSFYVGTANPIVALIDLAIGAVYFVLSWSGGRRATIGQRLFHIQVGNAFDGQALSTEQAVRRWLGFGSFLGLFAFLAPLAGLASLAQLVWGAVLLLSTVRNPNKQGLHDQFANSAVVKPSGQGTSGIAMACLLVIGLIVVLAIVGIVAAIMLGPAFFDQLSRLGRSI
jgi:uncharacterized RDD family membrane protein YckC